MRSRRLRSYAIPAMARVVMPEADMLAIDADGGTYVLAGQDVTFIRSRVMPAATGSYSLAGQSAELVKGIAMPAAGGSYVLSGQAANLLRNRVMAGEAGAYTLSGKDAALIRSQIMAADVGAYSVAGQDAALTKSSGSSIQYIGHAGPASTSVVNLFAAPQPGDTIIVFYGVSSGSATISGFTETGNQNNPHILYKMNASGSEGTSLTFTSGSIRSSMSIILRGIDTSVPVQEVARTTTNDPPAISPAWGTSKQTAFIALGYLASVAGVTPSVWPSGYTDGQAFFGLNYGSSNWGYMGAATKIATISSDDPSAWTWSSNPSNSRTLALKGL